VAGVVGQINDFAGGYESSGLQDIAADLSQNKTLPGVPADGSGIPVVVTGFKGPSGETLPGLREALIASAIIKLVAHIPPNNPLRNELRASALKLYTMGGDKISNYGKTGGSNGTGKRSKTKAKA
jgi:hypothetical protein